MGSLAAISQKTSFRFFEILEDTLIVNRINAYAGNETMRLVRHPKYYFYNGVLNGLLKNFTLSEDRRGFLFGHFIVNQILTANFTRGPEPTKKAPSMYSRGGKGYPRLWTTSGKAEFKSDLR